MRTHLNPPPAQHALQQQAQPSRAALVVALRNRFKGEDESIHAVSTIDTT
jgi:hypothetical protein